MVRKQQLGTIRPIKATRDTEKVQNSLKKLTLCAQTGEGTGNCR
jgi:methylmalonyl-CoA mutase